MTCTAIATDSLSVYELGFGGRLSDLMWRAQLFPELNGFFAGTIANYRL